MADKDIGAVGDQAAKLYGEGWNCAEAVCLAVGEATGHPVPVEMATCFGGGMGRSGCTCGALSGAILSVGFQWGRTAPERRAASRAYEVANRMCDRFREAFDFTECFVFSADNQAGKKRKASCAEYVRRAAELAMEAVAESGG